MHATLSSLRTLAVALAMSAALPAAAQDEAPDAPPPPDQLPWAAPARPEPPPARQAQPVYRPDYTVPGQRPPRPRGPAYPQAYPQPDQDDDGPPPSPRYGVRRAWQPHVELAFRGGISTPAGMAAEGVSMRDTFGEQVTVGVELGIRTTPHLSVGVFAEGGVGAAGPAYQSTSCSGSGWSCEGGAASGRIGMGVRYHLSPYAPVDPWVGYAVALSGAVASGDDAFGSYSRTLTGVEYAKLSAGVDLRLSRRSAVGLYAEWTSGLYTEVTDRADGAVTGSGDLRNPTTHTWFTVGPRLRF